MTANDWSLYLLLGALLVALVSLPSLIRAQFPRLYRGPVAALGAALAGQNYPLGSRIAGLISALAAVALLRWLVPGWFGGPGLSVPAALVLSLVVFMSFAVWRYGIRIPRLRRP